MSANAWTEVLEVMMGWTWQHSPDLSLTLITLVILGAFSQITVTALGIDRIQFH